VTKPELNESKVDTSLKQMSGKGVTKRVNRSEFVDAALLERGAEGLLNAALRQGLSRFREVSMLTSLGRKQKQPIAMSGPELAKEFESAMRQRDIAIFAAFATTDVEHHSGAVDIRDAKMSTFLKPQSTGVDSCEADPIARQTNQGENTADFIEGEDDRKFFLRSRANQRENRPLAVEGMGEEELYPAKSDGRGRARPLLDIDDEEKVVSEFIFRDQVRGLVEVLGELADGADVALLSANGVALKLKRLDHSLAKFGHGNTSCFGIFGYRKYRPIRWESDRVNLRESSPYLRGALSSTIACSQD
jgi:hypothetical protein